MGRKRIILFALLILSLGRLTAMVFHVAPEGNPFGAWADCVTLEQALNNAQPGDEIWVQGFDVITDTLQIYRPTKKEGFTLRSGVALYGGFQGNETDKSQRPVGEQAFEFTYRSVLSGDMGLNDVVDAGLIYPENEKRKDNVRVLTIDLKLESSGNDGRKPTVFDGFSVFNGQANDEFGGGVKVVGGAGLAGSYRITRCFFVNNYAQLGGAIYVDESVTGTNNADSYIGQCMVYNNVAGTSMNETGAGGGIYLAGYGVVVNSVVANNVNGGICMGEQGRVINSTVVRNTGGGIGMAEAYTGDFNVLNTVVWGNHALYSLYVPKYQNSAFPEQVQTGNGNVTVNEENVKQDVQSVFFTSPSIKAGYDHLFEWKFRKYPYWNWSLQENSVLIDKGADEAYTADNLYGESDFCGASRFKGTIDIGACEYQPLPGDRIRYVSPDGDDSDGSTWEKAYKTVQKAINDLYGDGTKGEGEVWVAAGVYEPTELLMPGNKSTAAFIMRDGIHVYGGFEGMEDSRAQRVRKSGGMPWEFVHKTVFRGSGFRDETLTWTNNRWTLNSSSNHVVWFASLDGKTDFKHTTILDGVTVTGGQSTTENVDVMFGDRGAGVYMHNANAQLVNCVVTGNMAENLGGGIWLSGGRVVSTLVYNNGANNDGGGVYMDNSGIVLRSMLVNNAAANGAGIYMDRNGNYVGDNGEHPEYLILSTSVVTNNTARENGAVYCNEGGVLIQNTINNNDAPRATDEADPNATRTGGLFIDGYALVINSVLWNNLANGSQVPMYARNIAQNSVRFMNTACSGMNNAVWNSILQQDLISLVEDNTGGENDISPDYEPGGQMADDNALRTLRGVQGAWQEIDFYWGHRRGGNLRAQGLAISAMPEEVMLTPELDIKGVLFAQKPALGAHMIERQNIVPAKKDNALCLYVDVECANQLHNGSSWEQGYRSLNEAVAYFAEELTEAELNGVERLEIHVMEGTLYPRYAYTDNDYRTGTIRIMKMPNDLPLYIYGGYSRQDTLARNPLDYRCIVDGNPDGGQRSGSLYHVITVEAEAEVVLDGFHVVNGYAVGEASQHYGAGMLVRDGAKATVRNSIFENNESAEGSAIDARNAGLTLINCVVNNNTNTSTSQPVVNAKSLSLNHVTVINNIGGAWSDAEASVQNSYAVGNSSGNTVGNLKTTGGEGAENFANPTNKQGATQGFDTYLGGYSNFTPLTGSAETAVIINQGTPSDVETDIAGNGRDLGGVPDLGAYEADLPETGRVYYVREESNGGSDSNDGLSWGTAFATIRKAVETADRGEVINGEKPQVWVSAGDYTQDPLDGSQNCFEIKDGVNVYGAFPKHGNPSMDDRQALISKEIYSDSQYSPADYETIIRPATATKSVRRVLGQPDRYNPANALYAGSTTYTSYEYVGAGKGNYMLVPAEYVEQNGGGWVYSENGGEYVAAEKSLCDWLYVDKEGYHEVVRDIATHKKATTAEEKAYESRDRESIFDDWVYYGEKSFVEVGVGYGSYNISEEGGLFSKWNKWTNVGEKNGEWVEFVSGQDYYEASTNFATYRYFLSGYNLVTKGYGDYIKLGKGWNYAGEGYGTHQYREASYQYVGTGKGDYVRHDKKYDRFTYKTTWDGFTIRDGYIDSKNIKFLDSAGKRNGGACAVIFTNVTIANSVLVGGINESTSNGGTLRGGGVYCDQGSLVGCYILKNTLGDSNDSEAYGGGCYMYSGTAYNCVISENETNGENGDGAGIFIENAEFYNNTIVKNKSNGNRGNGGICIYRSGGSSKLTIYNCIVMDNIGFKQSNGKPIGNKNMGRHDGTIVSYNSIFDTDISSGNGIEYTDCKKSNVNAVFVNYSGENYRLKSNSPALNMGDNIPNVDGKDIFLEDYTDMDFSDRIKDCTVDAGAYELDNEENIQPDSDYCYYVTIGGAGLSNASSPDNAACMMKLQDVLYHAGTQVAGGRNVVVKVAEGDYYANTLSNENDPQSYTFVIPYGVALEGGYDNTFKERDPYNNITKLIPQAFKSGQIVNGYHAVMFGDKPEGTAEGMQAVVDGCHLEGGRATADSGENSRGGGALVPAWGHVRNCVVHGNEAVFGGGLYLEAGATVSGTVVRDNSAEQGGGFYAGNEGAAADNRVHVVSCTVTDNKATSAGGGAYHEDGSAMVLNSVVWGNTAPSDNNVSGAFADSFEDTVLADMLVGVADVERARFTPYNFSFIETYNMPATFVNTSMSSDNKYFVDSNRRLKAYSELIKHGMETEYLQKLEASLKVAKEDMAGVARCQAGMDKADVGAFGYESGLMPVGEIVEYIFVSKNSSFDLADENLADNYVGKSFYTPLSWLDDALEYVRQVRENNPEARQTEFKILVAGGVYTPHYQREGAGLDRSNNSFSIPQGVSIYGGFKGDETWSSGLEAEVPGVSLTPLNDGNFAEALSGRASSDLNSNGVEEAYEFANQTILSGTLSASEKGAQAYHVLYSEAGGASDVKPVVLDGVTVIEGGSLDSGLPGGAVYSAGVPYRILRSRLYNNKSARGGAVYIENAGLDCFGSLFGGNQSAQEGGAVCLAGTSAGVLRAVNTIWANNEAGTSGGAIAVADGASGAQIDLMNNLLVRNKAQTEGAIRVGGAEAVLTNTAIWCNESTQGASLLTAGMTISHCASDEQLSEGNGNVLLNKDNKAVDGPRFASPSRTAGVEGNSAMSHWNPGAVSLLTDAGDGVSATGNILDATGAYKEWMDGKMPEYAGEYMADESYRRYAGRLKEDGTQGEHLIDIGVYEYQYPISFTTMNVVYVATEESGSADGTSWANATSDLWGAITGLAKSSGQAETKRVYVKAGNYAEHRLATGTAYTLNMGMVDNDGLELATDSLVIEGSYDAAGVQDFSQPTVIGVSPEVGVAGATEVLMDIKTNGRTVVLSGISFDGVSHAQGITAQVNNDGSKKGRLLVKNTAFRHTATGVEVATEGSDGALIANTLFADGGTGLVADSGTEVVNATFANNSTAAVEGGAAGNIYNSAFWETGSTDGIIASENSNVIFPAGQENGDVLNGPNFMDPDNGDYSLRPSDSLLNKGDSVLYKDKVGVSADEDLDLAGQSRRVGDNIDIGAYEYNAPLQPIVYVNQNVVGGDESGSSWENAVRDLQSAVDLATLYSKEFEGRNAYVFAYNTTKASTLNLSLGGVKVYGGMNGESISAGVDAEDVEAQVADLLGKRTPILSAVNRSQIENLSLSAGGVVDGFEVENADIRGKAGADDEISGWGMLSGSIVEKVRIEKGGVLYNSFLKQNPEGEGRLVNVTLGAEAEIPDGMENLHVAVQVPVNGYVGEAKEIWNRQLMENSEYIDKGGDETSIQEYMDYAGHKLDLSGCPRVMNGLVDYGCFETWNVGEHFVQNIQTVPTAEGLRPTANHVVYVREDKELNLREGSYAEGNAFNPCFLLLEHKAGLRGNGNWIALEHLGVERMLDAEGLDMAVMPFRVDSLTLNGARVEDLESTRLLYRYDGDERARHDYKFVASDESDAWKPSSVVGGRANLTEGWLLDGNNSDKVRFYGGGYTESSNAKEIILPQHNFRESWNNFADGVRFTHMENMGWNLFGSPFLCAMNYEDMEYGRVIYPYADGAYASPELTWDRDNNKPLDGHIPPFTAVFTQTATIRNEEKVDVYARTAELKEAKAYYGRLAIAFAQAVGSGSTAFEDMIQLTAVPSSEAEESFNLHTDGVKQGRIQAIRPQIYMLRDGGRYSLLSAVDVEGSVKIGVGTGEAGLFEFRIPADCDTYDYETVLLKDAELNRMVDLKEQSYGITLSEAGEQNDRFTLYFKRQSDRFTDNGIALFTPEDGMLAIKGLSGNSTIRLYSVKGLLVESRATSAHQEIFRLSAGTYLVEIESDTLTEPMAEKVYVK